MKQILFFTPTPYRNTLLQCGIGYDNLPAIIELQPEAAAMVYSCMNPNYVAQIYKSTSSYDRSELKDLAKKVYEALQSDSELTVSDVIFEAMDMLDIEIAEYQAEIDRDAIDDWAEQKGELSMS